MKKLIIIIFLLSSCTRYSYLFKIEVEYLDGDRDTLTHRQDGGWDHPVFIWHCTTDDAQFVNKKDVLYVQCLYERWELVKKCADYEVIGLDSNMIGDRSWFLSKWIGY